MAGRCDPIITQETGSHQIEISPISVQEQRPRALLLPGRSDQTHSLLCSKVATLVRGAPGADRARSPRGSPGPVPAAGQGSERRRGGSAGGCCPPQVTAAGSARAAAVRAAGLRLAGLSHLSGVSALLPVDVPTASSNVRCVRAGAASLT